MSLFRLPCSKFPLTFLAVPAGKDRRIECPCQSFDGFIVFIGSGVRYDLLLHKSKDEKVNQAAREYTRELITKHVSVYWQRK